MTPVRRALLHPITLVALALLLLNDHVLKAAFPGFWTGKLSDAAGLTFFPVVLAFALGARRAPAVAAAAAATALTFAAVKISGEACDRYAEGLGLAQWLVRVPFWALRGVELPSPGHAVVAQDPTDLLALPFVGIGVALTARPTR